MRHEVAELEHFPHLGALPIVVDLVRRISPDSLSVMEFKNEMDIRIADKMLQFPLLGEEIDGTWQLRLCNEFHMTNDSHLFERSPEKGCLPLFEGKMIWQFDLPPLTAANAYHGIRAGLHLGGQVMTAR